MNPTKPELSSIEIQAVVKELQFLIGAKIDQLYQADKKEFFLQLHKTGTGKLLLRMTDKLFYLTEQKPTMSQPTDFCMQLRKHLNNAHITKIEQLDGQRIVQLTLNKQSTFKLIIELFSKGNIILTENNIIKAILERQQWKSRQLKPNIEYKLPPSTTNLETINKTTFIKTITETAKPKLVTALATSLGLGGTYAEHLCNLSNVEKNTEPTKLTTPEKDEIWKAWQTIKTQLQNPAGYQYQDITPIPITNTKQTQKTFNQALDQLSTSKVDRKKQAKEQQYQKKVDQLQIILNKQQETLKNIKNKITTETQKGDKIYEKYQQINTLITKIKETQEKDGWAAAEKLLKQVKAISSIDLKNKKITLNIG
jgi:predicted ribosome quality control (RQC) complex YloA/Tae2 family protein